MMRPDAKVEKVCWRRFHVRRWWHFAGYINSSGVAAPNYGAGGSGVVAGSGGANQPGGAGKAGIVII